MTFDRKKDLFVLLLGLIGGVRLKLLGTFYASEIVIFIAYLFIPIPIYKENRYMKALLKFGVIWLLGAVISDIYNHSSLTDVLKGEFNIVFLLLQLPIIYWALADKPTRWLYYLGGCAIASIPNYFIFGTLDENAILGDDIFLYYALVPIFYYIVGLLYFRGKEKLACTIAVGFGFYMLFHGSRNVFLTSCLAVTILFFINKNLLLYLEEQITSFRLRIPRLFLALLLCIVVVDNVYEALASRGFLGEYAYEKYMKQKFASGGLSSSRQETFMGIELIAKKPLIGYGSFAKDKGNVFRASYASKHNTLFIMPTEDTLLPAHSHLVNSWMNHGILGGIFWIYVLSLMWRVFKNGAMLYEPRMLGAFFLIFMAMAWDIFFSPFGNRVAMVFFLTYLAVIETFYEDDSYGTFEIEAEEQDNIETSENDETE